MVGALDNGAESTHVAQEETTATVSGAIGHPTPGDEKELTKTEAKSPNFSVSHPSSENGYVAKETICSNTTNVNTDLDARKTAREAMNPGEEKTVVPPLSLKETTPFENVQEERASPDDDLLGSPPSKHPSPSTDANCLENATSADTEQLLSAALTAEEKKEVTEENSEAKEATRKGDAVSPSELRSNGEEISDGDDGIPSVGHNNYVMEVHTAEEKEWLSMGLNLGDALSKIAQLTKEKESALVICQEVNQVKALLAKVQSRLEDEMGVRADLEAQVQQGHKNIKSYEEQLSTYKTTEDDLQKARASLVESKQKEVVLSNRLNDAKKKEATKSTAAGRLEADNENLNEDLKLTKESLESVSRAKTKLESNMAKLKSKAVERVKQAETALSEERELNEERKKKMKVFVETKAEELREAKESANDMQKELEETRASLRSSRDREEAVHTDLEAARLKYRELQRNLERMKKNSEQLHLAGRNAEQELEKSTNETEEHKKKRISAKHEIMQMVRLLESERSVSAKLRESVKFSFLPKALSQQELLNEALRDFQLELERLAVKSGKTLLPLSESSEQDLLPLAENSEFNRLKKSTRKRASKVDMDTERLITNLEQETQHVSKGIIALAGSIERMRSLLSEDYGCMSYFSNVFASGTGDAKHQILGDSDEYEGNTSGQCV